MHIPRSKTENFVKSVIDECLSDQRDRINRGMFYKNYALYGSQNPQDFAIYNKTFAYLDDLASLLYSPVSLRFRIGDLELPSVVEEAKCRAASSKLRQFARKGEIDTLIEQAVWWSLVKGKAFLKLAFKRGEFGGSLIQPEAMGVLHPNHGCLDEDMEAFTHSMLITPMQLRRLLWDRSDRDSLLAKAKRQTSLENANLPDGTASLPVIVGGLYPFQASGVGSVTTRGVVDWMGSPNPSMSSNMIQQMIRLDEAWIWDNDREGWATFQMVGDDILIFPQVQTVNAIALNTATGLEVDALKDKHPFQEFCPNPLDGYFWGRSEIVNVAMLQESINARLAGINKMLRKQEEPMWRFSGSSSVNQNTFAKLNKPGGWISQMTGNDKAEPIVPEIPESIWMSIHENERMFDEMGGLPPVAKGRGEAGVRSQGHAETLVRMFSPRFKDRALLIERSVEGIAGSMLDLSRAHVAHRIIAWVPEQFAGEQDEPNPLIVPPAPGQVPVPFTFSDLDEDVTVIVDSHSASPAFMAEARSELYDLFKIGAASTEDVIERSDISGQEELIAGVQRREAQKAAQIQELERKGEEKEALKLIQGGGAKKK